MNKLLIVVDYQVDFVDGALGSPHAKAIEQPIVDKINAYYAEGQDIVFTLDTHDEHYRKTQEGKKLPVPHCIKGTPGWALYGKVGRWKEKTCFEKPAFACTALYDYLKTHQEYEQIELVGVVTNICVISNAVLAKAANLHAEVIVDAACTASNDLVLHEKALDVMESMQVTVINR